MGTLCDYVADYTVFRDFFVNTYPEYIKPDQIWAIASGSEYYVKEKLTVEGKIEVFGKVIILT